MVRIRRIMVVLLGVVVGIVAARHLFKGEEDRVKKQFRLVSKWVSRNPGEDVFTTAYKTQSMRALFAENFQLTSPVHSFSGNYTREEISSYIASARLEFSRLSLRFYDLDIDFPDKATAKVTLTAKLTGKMTDGEYVDETHELECILKKVENKWLFSNCEVVEVLRR